MALALALCTVAAPREAQAQTDDATRLEQAREFYRNGVAAFRARRYGDAVIAFERSYRLRPHPTTLYNAAEARLRGGDRERALEQLRDLLAMRDPAPDADTIERSRALAREAGEVDLRATPPPQVCPPQRECPAQTPCPECPTPQPVAAPAGAVPLALVIGGSVVLATGTAFYAAALAQSGAYNNPDTPVSVRRGLASQGEAFRIVGLVGFIAGAATEIAGIYLLARTPPRPPAPPPSSAANQTSFTARIEVLGNGLGVVGTF